MTEEDYQDTIISLKRKAHSTEGIMSDALVAMTDAYTSAREDAKSFKAMVDSRQRDSEAFLRDILAVLYREDESSARVMIEEKLSHARA